MSSPATPGHLGSLAIHVAGLTRRYASGAQVGPLAFAVPRGAITGLVGPNGVGKTTAIRMLLGLVRPDAGEVQVLDATDWSQLPEVLRRVGALVDGPALIPTLTGRKNLLMLARLAGWAPSEVDDALGVVGLADRADRLVREYSLGMRQRLALAGALLGDPELLILDEPANGLDPQGISELRVLLRDIASRGTTILVSSHVLSEVEQICEHLVVMSEQGVVFSGARAELTSQLSGVVVVEAADGRDQPQLRTVIEELGHPVRPGSDDTLIVEPRTSGVDAGVVPDGGQINARAIAAGIVLSRLEPRRQSLEDIFFDLTGDPGSTGDRLGRSGGKTLARREDSQ